MNQHSSSFRIWTLCLLIALVLGVFAVRLYQLQVVQATDLSGSQMNTYTYRTVVSAARGELIDCNGNVLVGNRASYNVIIIYNVLFSTGSVNESLRQLTNLCQLQELDIMDHLPVTMEKPYEYTKDDYSAVWNNYFSTFLNERDWDSDISAPQLISRLKDRYNIPEDWTEEEARRVISLRYELELRLITNLPTYELVQDVDTVSLAAITELGIPGVNVITSTVREYKTTYAAHILGYVGSMNSEEYEYYSQYGYEMDAKVGKDGLEKAYELELHGTDGLKETTISADGTILKEEYIKTPVAGNNVELTIDLDLQTISEDELESTILDFRENGINNTDQGKDAEGGSIVVMKVDTGEVLVCASYPTYDPSTFFENYNELLQEDYGPLYNRALQAELPPGSVFKMVTAIATIDNGIAGPGYKIEDKGVYKRFEASGYTPRCMLYTTSKGTQTHGWIDVREALAASCNYYFYEIGWMTGIEKIDAVAKALGLGEPSGVELPENTGYRANAETKKRFYTGSDAYWYDGDTIAAAIGQSLNRFTTMQLCSYTAALANQGTRYSAHFMRRVLSSDYDELIDEYEPTIASQLDISDTAYEAYVEGMKMSTYYYYGTVTAVFYNYGIDVAVKSGTAQHGSGGSDNASLVLFAPADDPEIAIAIYVEKGASGGKLGYIAKSIMDAYFSETSAVDLLPAENTPN